MRVSYDFKNLRGDIIGGITVAIVALPLAIAFGMSSMPGDPQGAMAGLYGAIFTGIFATVFGATNGLVNGPTAAMIVVLAGAYTTTGPSGFFLAMFIASLMQIVLGLLKLGKYIHFIPRPVIAGFTNGIGITILISKFADFKTSPIIAILIILIMFIPLISNLFKKSSIALKVSSFFKLIPASLIGLIIAVFAAKVFFPNIQYISGIPSGLPHFSFPKLAGLNYVLVFKNAAILCILASIESLLSAVVIDDMQDQHSDSNKELIGQGIGNTISSLFGGLMGTGAIIRSAVNVNSGGRTKLSGIIHAVIIFLITVKFGYLAKAIPTAALAGILMVTAFRMIEFESIKMLKNVPKSDAFVMIATMIITVFADLMLAVAIGTVLSALLFTVKMSKNSRIPRRDKGIVGIEIITIPGPLFFGCIKEITTNIRNSKSKIVVLNMSRANIVDETAVTSLFDLKNKMKQDERCLILTRLTQNAKETINKMFPNDSFHNFIFDDSTEAVKFAEKICEV